MDRIETSECRELVRFRWAVASKTRICLPEMKRAVKSHVKTLVFNLPGVKLIDRYAVKFLED